MKKLKLFTIIFSIALVAFSVSAVISDNNKLSEREKKALVDTRIDNMGYWMKMAAEGLVPYNPNVQAAPAIYTGSKLNARLSPTTNSPDVPVTNQPSTQSENSIIVDPNTEETALNSNNSTPQGGGSVYGADGLFTFDIGETWEGSIYGVGGNNSGDPAAGIDRLGRWYVGYINNGGGQSISYSDDQGQSWTRVTVATGSTDKNHLWVDTKEGSPYVNNVYVAWMQNSQTMVKRSTDRGETWTSLTNISSAVNAGSHNQGVNLATGPNGEVYAAWSVYDSWPGDEKAIGFNRSLDGGATWETGVRIINNIRGIRNSGVPQNMRVNSFPSMACDVSDGPYSGTIYVVWTNVGVPGQNSGNDRDVYLIKSTDDGITWSSPIRVNQDPIGQGKAHYFPWITVDPSNGIVSVIFYDNRNTAANQAEAWVATSNDGGNTWDDFKVSDVSFTPQPIPGLASGYFGDYISITALNGKVYPCWTDNRTGTAMTYVSVFETVVIENPYGLTADVDQETGLCTLNWQFPNQGTGFEYFKIYRNGVQIDTTTQTTYEDQLPQYGYYDYQVTAYYGGNSESLPTSASTQWGTSTIVTDPDSFTANVFVDDSVIQMLKIKNTGVLDLTYSLSPFFAYNPPQGYEPAKGGGFEYIHKVTVGNDFWNSSAYEGYGDFTANPVFLSSGQSYKLTVTNGNSITGDRCMAWIDWNQNGRFDEEPIALKGDENGYLFTGNIYVKKGTPQGYTRMRIRLAGPDEKLSAYGNTEYGEVEDYSLYVADWLTLNPDKDTIAPGDSVMVQVKFNALGMATGTYNTSINLITNDMNTPSVHLPATMNVTDLMVTASATPDTVCYGGEVQLSVTPQGGSGTYTYSWTSIPEGFTSSEQNPVVIPEQSTQYIVEVNDGVLSMFDTLQVTVLAAPQVDLGDDMVLCGETQTLLDAGNEGSTYLWSTGETSQTITASGEGINDFWVTVTNENGCSATDTVTVNFAAIPEIDLGGDTAVCGGVVYQLDAGNEGSTYLWSTGETTQFIEVDTTGFGYGVQNLSVEVTSEYGCQNSAEVNIEFIDCTGIDEYGRQVNMKVFPNPGNGMFRLQLNNFNDNRVSVKVMDNSGVVVYENQNVNVNDNPVYKLNLTKMPAGVYTLMVKGKSTVAVKKLIVEK